MNIFMLEILNLHRVSFVILVSLSWIDVRVNKVKKLFAVQDVTNVIFTEAALGIVENVKNLIWFNVLDADANKKLDKRRKLSTWRVVLPPPLPSPR